MDKVTRQFPQTTTFLKRKESRSGIEPRSFRLPPNALSLGQTGSQLSVDRWNAQYTAVCGRSKLPGGRVILSRSEKSNRQASRSDSSDNIATQEAETILKYIGQRQW